LAALGLIRKTPLEGVCKRIGLCETERVEVEGLAAGELFRMCVLFARTKEVSGLASWAVAAAAVSRSIALKMILLSWTTVATGATALLVF